MNALFPTSLKRHHSTKFLYHYALAKCSAPPFCSSLTNKDCSAPIKKGTFYLSFKTVHLFHIRLPTGPTKSAICSNGRASCPTISLGLTPTMRPQQLPTTEQFPQASCNLSFSFLYSRCPKSELSVWKTEQNLVRISGVRFVPSFGYTINVRNLNVRLAE